MNFSLIVPAAAHKEDYSRRMPRVFRLNAKGIPLCVEAVMGLDLQQFSDIYFTILRLHDELYGIAAMLRIQLDRVGLQRVRIVILDKPTSSQAATICQTIEKESITGTIFVKDADSYFRADILPQNGIAVFPLERLEQVNPQHKSYVAVDDMRFVTNTIEKRVIDHFFNAGGYCFEDAQNFISYCQRYADMQGLYLSHIVYAMLLDRHIFRPFMADDYKDLHFEWKE